MTGLEDWWRATGRTDEAWRRYQRVLDLYDPVRDSLDAFQRLAGFAIATALYVPNSEPQRKQLARRTRAGLERVDDPDTKLTTLCTLLVAEFDECDAQFDAKAAAALRLAHSLDSGWEASLFHYLTIWQLTDEPARATETARSCMEAARLLGIVEELRADIGRVRLALEELPHRYALEACGPSAVTAGRDMTDATTLAYRILVPIRTWS